MTSKKHTKRCLRLKTLPRTENNVTGIQDVEKLSHFCLDATLQNMVLILKFLTLRLNS